MVQSDCSNSLIFLFSCSGPPRDLLSFPTRRSSDLGGVRSTGAAMFRAATFRAPLPHGHARGTDRKSTRLNSSHVETSYAVFCLKKNVSYPTQRIPTLVPFATANHRQAMVTDAPNTI